MDINQYIIYIQKDGKLGGELEKYASKEIYDINIADYKEIKNNLLNPIYHQYIHNLNQNNNYNKDLCLITQVNNDHFNLIFDSSYNAYKDENNRLFLNLNNTNNNINNVNYKYSIIKNLISKDNNNKNVYSNLEKNNINCKKHKYIKNNNNNIFNKEKFNIISDNVNNNKKVYITKENNSSESNEEETGLY